MTNQEEVLAHLGNALLAAQVVERFVGFALSAEPLQKDSEALDLFLARSWLERSAHLREVLAALGTHGWEVEKLDIELRRFQESRNKLVHCFHTLGAWDFRKVEDCHECVTFLRDFIDQSASLQHLFVSVLSMRDRTFRTRVPASESNQYAKDYREIYLPLTVRWTDRIVA
ncbi:MAG: hypothetical protein ABL964_00660 [Steroidobacteraceae bacterium]